MARPKKEKMNRLVQTTVDDLMYRALCERAITEDRPIASVMRQAVNFYLAHLERIKNVELK